MKDESYDVPAFQFRIFYKKTGDLEAIDEVNLDN